MNQIAELFDRITVGVYVVTVAHEQRRDAFTAAWVMPASYRPPRLAVSVNPANASHAILLASGAFVVNVLGKGQADMARHFGTRSGREHDKLAGVAWWPAHKGAPVLGGSIAYFECELDDRVRGGDHDLVLGRVVGGRVLDPQATPMNYAQTGAMDGSSALFPESY